MARLVPSGGKTVARLAGSRPAWARARQPRCDRDLCDARAGSAQHPELTPRFTKAQDCRNGSDQPVELPLSPQSSHHGEPCEPRPRGRLRTEAVTSCPTPIVVRGSNPRSDCSLGVKPILSKRADCRSPANGGVHVGGDVTVEEDDNQRCHPRHRERCSAREDPEAQPLVGRSSPLGALTGRLWQALVIAISPVPASVRDYGPGRPSPLQR